MEDRASATTYAAIAVILAASLFASSLILFNISFEGINLINRRTSEASIDNSLRTSSRTFGTLEQSVMFILENPDDEAEYINIYRSVCYNRPAGPICEMLHTGRFKLNKGATETQIVNDILNEGAKVMEYDNMKRALNNPTYEVSIVNNPVTLTKEYALWVK